MVEKVRTMTVKQKKEPVKPTFIVKISRIDTEKFNGLDYRRENEFIKVKGRRKR